VQQTLTFPSSTFSNQLLLIQPSSVFTFSSPFGVIYVFLVFLISLSFHPFAIHSGLTIISFFSTYFEIEIESFLPKLINS